MRTAKINLAGGERTLCFSLRVVRACAERYGDVSLIGDAMTQADQAQALGEALWLLAAMMDAGHRYALKNGQEEPEPLSEDDLYDICDLSEMGNLRNKIMETVRAGEEVSVAAAPPKNAEATPEA